MNVKIIPAIAGILLVGCSSVHPPATQRIDLPVAVPCVKESDVPKRPDYEVEKLAPGATDGEKVLAFAADWPRGRKYERRLEALIDGCRQPPAQPPQSPAVPGETPHAEALRR